jgi:hypothetical protein
VSNPSNPSNPSVPATPAGWYSDPENTQRLRWWDGVRWTEQFAPVAAPAGSAVPYTGSAPLAAPAGTDWNTPWIWVVLFLPLLPVLPLLFIDWSGAFVVDSDTLVPDVGAQFAFLTSPAYLASLFGGWLAYAIVVICAYADWRALRDRGVPAPFHWAWAFLSSAVYGIGRGVVVSKRTGRGQVVIWLAIATIVLSLVIGLLVAGAMFGAVFSQLPTSLYTAVPSP